jgi:ABC-type sugar transport system ATPase subunit
MGKLLLKMRNISKNFGPIQALRDVNFDLRKGEIVGLVGDNAAGKSTLLKTIYGIHRPDRGKIFLEGRRVDFKSPREARNWGIEMVFQDFMLCPELDVVSNAFLGREITKLKMLLIRKKMEEMAKRIVEQEGLGIDVSRKVMELSGGQQQLTSILRIFLFNPKIVLLDEPTASLSASASAEIIEQLKRMKKKVGMIYVSHKLPEVISISDRIVVLRRGEVAGEVKSKKATPLILIKKIIGG